jgi:hypothetical protein
MLNSISRLNSFVDRNINQLLEMKVEKYPINRENVRTWLQSQQVIVNPLMNNDEEVQELREYIIAKIVANNMLNVSYDDIMSRLNNIANELHIMYFAEGLNLSLYLPDNIKKSNFFFTLVFYNMCRMKGILFNGLENMYNKTMGKRTIVIVDDVSYSGSQICSHIDYIDDGKWSDHYFIAIPYVSINARRKIVGTRTNTRFMFPSSATEFRSIKQYLTQEDMITIGMPEPDPNEDASIEEDYQLPIDVLDDEITKGGITRFNNMISLIYKHILYIDFKLPDTLSIPQTIFAYGYKVSDPMDKTFSNSDNVLSFITGCENIFKDNIQYPKGEFDLNNKHINGGMCPQSFYKRINWNLEIDDTFDTEIRNTFVRHEMTSRGFSDSRDITSIEVRSHEIPDLQTFAYFPNLTILKLNELIVDDLSKLPKLPKLRQLFVNHSQILYLKMNEFPTLIKLDLRSNNIINIDGLSHLKSIRHLELSNNSINDISQISELPNISILKMDDNLIDDVSKLSTRRTLTELSLVGNWIINVAPLASLNNLKILRILSGNRIVDVDSLKNLNVFKNRNIT